MTNPQDTPGTADAMLRCLRHAMKETTGDLVVRVPAYFFEMLRQSMGPQCVGFLDGRRLTFEAHDGDCRCFYVNGQSRFLS